MPTVSLSFPSLLNNTLLSSLFLPNTNTTPTIITTLPHLLSSSSSALPPPSPLARTMDAVELRRVFKMFDQNGDGRISMGELTASLENMGIFIPDADLAHMIGQIDANGDGCVDGEEFKALHRLIMEERERPENEEDDMKEAFNVFDKNGDGFISVDELRTVLASLGLFHGRSLEDCKLMIMKVDVDGDGRVSFKEFKKMMKEGGLAAFN